MSVNLSFLPEIDLKKDGIKSIIDASQQRGLHVNYDFVGENKALLLFKVNRFKYANINFHGLIVEYPSLKVVFMPEKYKFKNTHTQEDRGVYYYKYPIYYGTFVGLYYYDDKWRMSTANSLYINKKSLYGKVTFEENLESCLQVTFDEFCSKLDKEKTYRFGFSTFPDGMFLEKFAWSLEDIPYVKKITRITEKEDEILQSAEKGIYGIYYKSTAYHPGVIKTTFTYDILQNLLAKNNTPATIREFGYNPLKWVSVLAWSIPGYSQAIEKYYPETKEYIDELDRKVDNLIKTREDKVINDIILRRTSMDSSEKVKKIVIENPENTFYLYSLIS